MLFGILLALGMASGLLGGWKFGQIKNQLHPSWHSTFDGAAVLMLAQDVLIAFFYLRGVAVIVFLLIISFCPAIGLIAFDKFEKK